MPFPAARTASATRYYLVVTLRVTLNDNFSEETESEGPYQLA